VVEPVIPTNIVVIDTSSDATAVAASAADRGVLVTRMGPHTIRCVTHIGVDEAECREAAGILAGVLA
jgi:threonine aldolase